MRVVADHTIAALARRRATPKCVMMRFGRKRISLFDGFRTALSKTALALIAIITAVVSAHAQKSSSSGAAETALTMAPDYTITLAGTDNEGKYFRLNHIAKDGTVYETIDLIKTGQNGLLTTYSGTKGTYTRNAADGTLQEPLGAEPRRLPPTAGVEPPLTLMKTGPTFSLRTTATPTKLQSTVLPDGQAALRDGLVDGRPVKLLATEIRGGIPHEIAVTPIGARLDEEFYVRISNPTRDDEPLVFGVLDNNVVTAYSAVPQGLGSSTAATTALTARPQVSTRDNSIPEAARAETSSRLQPARVSSIIYPSGSFRVASRPDGTKDFSIPAADGSTNTFHVKPLSVNGVASDVAFVLIDATTNEVREVNGVITEFTLIDSPIRDLSVSELIRTDFPIRSPTTPQTVTTTQPSNPARTQTSGIPPEGNYHSEKYPVHADKDASGRFFYHLTLAEAIPAISVVPRLPTDLFKQYGTLSAPGQALTNIFGIRLPYTLANVIASTDYTQIEGKDGDRQRDWMLIDNGNNITYFQLAPAHELKKGTDGAWTTHVSKDPPPLHDLKKGARK
ncbi:MAG TPA: hypothetical protein VHZ74_15880 [Bryobacteraceae bacterium]|jgi:hypothetical protein|nr:hypothetical protein [Bryobacteraceae bacterium]